MAAVVVNYGEFAGESGLALTRVTNNVVMLSAAAYGIGPDEIGAHV
jgi:hypothetical protein